jgi:hypothetical protein
MTQDQGDLLRDAGIEKVSANTPEEWSEGYRKLAQDWFERLPAGSTFLGEDMRAAAEPTIGKPKHPNAWSAAARRAINKWKGDRRVAHHGAVTSKAAANHSCLRRQYIKLR